MHLCTLSFSVIVEWTIKLTWLIVALTGFAFNGANLYGYIRCKVGGADAVKDIVQHIIMQDL